MRRAYFIISYIVLFAATAYAMQSPVPVQGWRSINLATLTHWAALYVLYSSMLVNFLAGVELILKTIEDWANDNMFGNFATKVTRVAFYVAAATDLIDRIGAINFKDKIRPKRFNQRSSDSQPPDTAARAAGIGA
jgi:hypothetical protein